MQALLARQKPVATDLRRVLAMLHVNLHLERIADYCVTVARLTRLTADLPVDESLEHTLEQMGRRAQEMLEVAMASFLSADAAGATRLVELDDAIDSANRDIVRRVLVLAADETRREWGLRVILLARCIERLGDRAVDIGEQTAYMVTGRFHEFTDAAHPGTKTP